MERPPALCLCPQPQWPSHWEGTNEIHRMTVFPAPNSYYERGGKTNISGCRERWGQGSADDPQALALMSAGAWPLLSPGTQPRQPSGGVAPREPQGAHIAPSVPAKSHPCLLSFSHPLWSSVPRPSRGAHPGPPRTHAHTRGSSPAESLHSASQFCTVPSLVFQISNCFPR